ncbi:hypothetical protein TSUD_349820 [Trifolium subterraneum]|uniref:Uncharacterized protein n=1 Tax=Trifolium subterraneum TaxID=3900 RepID=A0A2Z6ND30_TRISU|nr:hypothetical protein TSUD_349820 [Trifolium subterraneum]
MKAVSSAAAAVAILRTPLEFHTCCLLRPIRVNNALIPSCYRASLSLFHTQLLYFFHRIKILHSCHKD